jgi:hypothetical protein
LLELCNPGVRREVRVVVQNERVDEVRRKNVHSKMLRVRCMSNPLTGVTETTFYEGMRSGNREGIASLYFGLLINQWQWIFRKVETVSMAEDRRIRRQMSIDFLVPKQALAVAERMGLVNFPVPLVLLKKGLLTALDVRDDKGSSIPVLTRSQNGELGCLGLHTIAVTILGLAPTLGLGELIENVVTKSKQDCTVLLRLLGNENLSKLHSQKGEIVAEVAEQFAEQVRWSVETLSSQFVLVVDMPIQKLKERQIVKISYESSLTPHPQDGASGSRGLITYVAGRLGLIGSAFRIPIPEIRNCHSYHFELRAPTGLDIANLRISPAYDGEGISPLEFNQASISGSVGHCTSQLAVRGESSGVDNSRFNVKAALTPSSGGLALAASASGVIATTLIALGIVVAKNLVGHPADPSVSLLLVVPGITMSLIARPGEHVLASQILRPFRIVTMIPGLMAFAAAAELVSGPTVHQLRETWTYLLVVSAISTCLIVLIAITGWIRRRFRTRPSNS